MLCSLWILGSQARVKPMPSTVTLQSPNHWTTREFPQYCIFNRSHIMLMLQVFEHNLSNTVIKCYCTAIFVFILFWEIPVSVTLYCLGRETKKIAHHIQALLAPVRPSGSLQMIAILRVQSQCDLKGRHPWELWTGSLNTSGSSRETKCVN